MTEFIGEAIRRLRGTRRQAALAEAAGMSAPTWSDYERGKKVPRPPQLARIVKALGCDMATFEAELRGAAGPHIAVEELLLIPLEPFPSARCRSPWEPRLLTASRPLEAQGETNLEGNIQYYKRVLEHLRRTAT